MGCIQRANRKQRNLSDLYRQEGVQLAQPLHDQVRIAAGSVANHPTCSLAQKDEESAKDWTAVRA
jgi:hypothetical protein